MAGRSVYMNGLGDKIDIINMDLRDIPYILKSLLLMSSLLTHPI